MGAYTYDGPEQCTDRKGLGAIKPNTERTVNVPANKRIVLTVGIDLGFQPAQLLMAGGAVGGLLMAAVYKGCTPTIDFVPQEGQQYVFRIDKELTTCAYHFEIASATNDTVPPLKYAEREWTRPVGESGPFCTVAPTP
ncbi:hypothetical protein hmeg3_23660 [Herbaspirillum sp. meg3]|uniref:hypothetical protein n=1 Tax=Herbaspirillum sp. meg3 TaxID=2025949 RepID=UPI000B98FA4F|nr:hypothetical protein [Herbaspirillum sp. meg3]ASU41000.1 hypothetical protein hmeg3_23660 [Herbaspirillum sp. meg3]